MDAMKKTFAGYCLTPNCSGCLSGTLGGVFVIGQCEYSQILNAKCEDCGAEYAEIFEVWNNEQEEYWVTDEIAIGLDEDSSIVFPGLGCPAAEFFEKNLDRLEQSGLESQLTQTNQSFSIRVFS